MKLVTKIKHLPQRQKTVFALAALLVLIGVGMLVWAISSGLIKPKAASSTQISNTATATYQDASGNSYTVSSNTVLVDVIPAANATLTLSPATSSTAVGSTFEADIILNTSSQISTETDVILSYNTTELQAVTDMTGSTPATQITSNTPAVFSTVTTNTVTSGVITYKATGSYNGSGILAKIYFKSLKATAPSKVQFAFTSGVTTDSNVLIADGSDILSAATEGDYTLTNPVSNTVNLSLALSSGSDFTTSAATFAICPTGSTAATKTNICGTSTAVYQKTDVATNSSGTASFTITPPAAGSYDYKIKVNGYLVKAIKNTAYANPLTLNFSVLKAGDLDNDNTVTGADFIAFRTKYLTTDTVADFDHDGTVTGSDFVTFRKYYLQSSD